MAASIADRARLDLVRYANVWEDAAVLCTALRPAPGRRLLSIASGGDNAFALLAHGADVVAVDLSPAQLALVELKVAAIRQLAREDLLEFLGFGGDGSAAAEPLKSPGDRGSSARPAGTVDGRRQTYAQLRGGLSTRARAFWDARGDDVARGVGHAGKFERYFALFRTRVLPLVHSRRTVLALLEERSLAERRRFYAERWDGWRWRLLFWIFFSRIAMGRLGRDPEFFRYVDRAGGSVASRILERARHALTELPTHDNPYLEAILTGRFARSFPLYLRTDLLPRVRENLGRLELVQGSIDEVAVAHRRDGFDGFNLSDLFEYLDEPTGAALYGRLLDAARPGARLAYWNLLVPRRRPDAVAARVRSLDAEAAALHARDQAFFYSRFVLEESIG